MPDPVNNPDYGGGDLGGRNHAITFFAERLFSNVHEPLPRELFTSSADVSVICKVIDESHISPEQLLDLTQRLLKHRDVPKEIVGAMVQEFERMLGAHLSIITQNIKPIQRLIGENGLLTIFQNGLSRLPSTALIVEAIGMFSTRAWARPLEPFLAAELKDESVLIGAIQSGVDTSKMPGISSIYEVLDTLMAAKTSIDWRRILNANEPFVLAVLCMPERSEEFIHRIAQCQQPELIVKLIDVVLRNCNNSIVKERSIAIFDQIRFTCDSLSVVREDHLIPALSAHISFIQTIQHARSEPPAHYEFTRNPPGIDRLLLEGRVATAAGMQAHTEDQYWIVLDHVRREITQFSTDDRPPLWDLIVEERLPAGWRNDLRKHPLSWFLKAKQSDLQASKSIESWYQVPHEVRELYVRCAIYDSPAFSPQLREKLLNYPVHEVRDLMDLASLSQELCIQRDGTFNDFENARAELRRGIQQWVKFVGNLTKDLYVSQLDQISDKSLVDIARLARGIHLYHPELSGKLLPAIFRLPEPTLAVEFAIDTPMTLTLKRIAYQKIVADGRTNLSGFPNLLIAQREYAEIAAPLREFDLKKREALTCILNPSERAYAYQAISQERRDYRKDHNNQIQNAQARLFVAGILSDRVDIDAQRLALGNHSWPLDRVLVVILASAEMEVPGVRTLVTGFSDLINKNRMQETVTVSDRVGSFERLALAESPESTCLSIRDMTYPVSLAALGANHSLRPLVVRDASGQVIARALTFQGTDLAGRAALFVERVYPGDADTQMAEVILAWCREKAYSEELRLVLSEGFMRSINAVSNEALSRVRISGDDVFGVVFSDSLNSEVVGSFTVSGVDDTAIRVSLHL